MFPSSSEKDPVLDSLVRHKPHNVRQPAQRTRGRAPVASSPLPALTSIYDILGLVICCSLRLVTFGHKGCVLAQVVDVCGLVKSPDRDRVCW